jgi:23S rRNA (cytosine1962-C5)-methyltransferase
MKKSGFRPGVGRSGRSESSDNGVARSETRPGIASRAASARPNADARYAARPARTGDHQHAAQRFRKDSGKPFAQKPERAKSDQSTIKRDSLRQSSRDDASEVHDAEYEAFRLPKSSYQPRGDLPIAQMKIERRSTHPWVYQDMVHKPATKPRNGAVVDVVDATEQWVGRGFYSSQSKIALRILTTDPEEAIDEHFFQRRIERAIHLRNNVLELDAATNAYRLVHSEGDELSGLIIDRYANWLVLEYFSVGMWLKRDQIRKALTAIFPGVQLFWLADKHAAELEGFDPGVAPAAVSVTVQEHGLKFLAAPGSAHKTGFFADQRDARAYFAKLLGDESKPDAAGRVLDLCCNTGGFAIYAKHQLPKAEVTGVDLDETVIALAEQNAKLNHAKIRFIHADIFPWLRDSINNGERFDAVVLDPAKMTRDREQVIPALKKYLDMNKLALSVVRPGGLFLSCSCTGLVSEAQFLDMLRRAAYYSQRSLQIIKVMGAGSDHPFMAQVQESRYLKAVFCRVF